MKVIVIEIPETGGCTVKAEADDCNDPINIVSDELRNMIDDGAHGDKITITLKEMSEEDYEALPEWTGW